MHMKKILFQNTTIQYAISRAFKHVCEECLQNGKFLNTDYNIGYRYLDWLCNKSHTVKDKLNHHLYLNYNMDLM